MDKSYFETVQLLLAVTPEVFRNPVFAMKGGTAINLFVRDMPRLSVDIDVVYTPWEPPRSEALNDITAELGHRVLCDVSGRAQSPYARSAFRPSQ